VVRVKHGKKWRCEFDGNVSKHLPNKTVASKEEGEAYIKQVNVEEKLPIRNMVYFYQGQYYCTLTQNQLMKFALENLDLVEKHCWYARFDQPQNCYYAYTSVKSKGVAFHDLICPVIDQKLSVDHINRDTLNNMPVNLRRVSHTIQNINRKISSRNKTGIVGVTYNKSQKRYSAHWNIDRLEYRRHFSVTRYGDEAFAMAVACRKEIENTHKDYMLALCK